MRSFQFFVFISIFLGIYFLINYYLFVHGFQALSDEGWVRTCYTGLFVLFASSYLVSRLIENTELGTIHHIFYWVGSMWFAAFLYFLLSVLLIDFIRLLDVYFHFLPAQNSGTYRYIKLCTFIVSAVFVFSVLVYGYINASKPIIKNLKLTISKKAGDINDLAIVMVSDIHLGDLVNKQRVVKLVNSINASKPDIVLIAGDALDEVQKPILRYDIGSPLRDLKSRFGVYGITGNHEYIGGVGDAVKYLESLNIKILRDTAVKIDNSFYLVGREDKDMLRFKGKERKPLKDILGHTDPNYPVILMDHQPYRLDEAADNHVDLQLSGHTHHGQFWPLNYITQKVYEVSWGYKLKKQTHFYVSCGYGTWGPPVRIGNKPEIVIIHLTFQPVQ